MEIINNAIQTVAQDQNVIFTDTVVKGNCSIVHREGSGLVTLRGITDQCRARYKVSFGGNVAIPSGGTVAPISVALSINGEAVASSTMISTPAAAEQFNNIFGAIFLDVPRGCCYQVGVKNLTDSAIKVQNANLIVERVA